VFTSVIQQISLVHRLTCNESFYILLKMFLHTHNASFKTYLKASVHCTLHVSTDIDHHQMFKIVGGHCCASVL
jgi:hypothetical protein